MACKLAVISGMAFEARLARGPEIQNVYGLNSARLEVDIERAIAEGARGLLSFGVAAGLSPELAPGAVVVARAVRWRDEVSEADAEWAARLRTAIPGALEGDIAGVDAPLKTVQEKTALGAQGAIADMESHRIAWIASRHGLPFACIRVVLDGADRALPPAALAVRKDGTVDSVKLLRSLITHPSQLPALLHLAADSRAAKRSLLHCGQLGCRLFLMDVG